MFQRLYVAQVAQSLLDMEMEHKLPLELGCLMRFLVDSTFYSQFWILAFFFFVGWEALEVIELLTLRMNS